MTPLDISMTPQIETERATLLNRQVAQLDRLLDNPYSGPKPIAQTGILEQIGGLLWEAAGLSVNELLEAIETARDDETPMRLTVTGEAFQHLPWEMLYHEHPELGFVGRHPWCVVTRRMRGDGRKTPQVMARPLRLLLFIASPEDLDPERSRLDFEREEELLFTALDGPWSRGELDIDVAEDGRVSTLRQHLERHRYHAVILSMHGTPARNRQGGQEWGLLFEDERSGRGAPLAGSDLVTQFEQLPRGHRPGLMVLSACRSARAEETAESITSVARKVHERGLERVLGMRLSVLDGAASCFSAELFRRLALGEVLGRAVTLARDTVAQGAWLTAGDESKGVEAVGDPYAQWTLPVSFDRTADGTMVDIHSAVEVTERPAPPSVLIGDGTIRLPSRATFIGRRRFIREHLRVFLEGQRRCLMLTGAGGVGKTALAGLFARALTERQPATRLLGFRAPFELKALEEPLRQEAFDGTEEPALLTFIQAEPDRRQRLRRLLTSLAGRQRPCAFVLDNLEVLQDLRTLEVSAEHQDSLWFLHTICELPSPTRVLLTGRYLFRDMPVALISQCPVRDAPYGDVLRRMNRLNWPQTMSAVRKRWVYTVLGGNHRAIEWTAQLLANQQQQADELVETLERLQAPPGTPEEVVSVVLEAMRQNLLLSTLRQQLTAEQDRLLRAASLYRVPVNDDGLMAIALQPEQCEVNRQRLVAYALLEWANDLDLDLAYFVVPPVVKELLGDRGFDPPELQSLHQVIGTYHRFQGEYLSRRWSDDIEAIYHFRQAGDHVSADALAEYVCDFYYRISNYAGASAITEEIVGRSSPPAPWWALNRYGMCQLTLGFPNSALAAFKRALPVAPTKRDAGTTLNNISQIYKARGDYDTALRYLEQSLGICQEIGNKAGEGTTLNNMATTAYARGDYDTALRYLEQSLGIQQEIGDKAGEGTTLNNMATTAYARGDYDTALRYLEQSLGICQEIGNKAGEGTTLNNISGIYRARGDYDTALRYLEQSLGIRQEIGDKAGEGATLNNISQIYKARGDYDTALRYLEQSLGIQQEIGDKAGEGTTLNNMGHIAMQSGDLERAVSLWSEALALALEIQDARLLFHVASTLGQVLAQAGVQAEARNLLQMAVQVGKQAGFPQVQQVEQILRQLPPEQT
jgi:tetratricopeptide (TPR) repeat protein